MKNFTNPLDNIKIASPCPANWNEMYGNERQRYCSECKLNVYNLSDMTRPEAESFLINAEGRVCVKFYRRADGTVLTQDCPVGWQAVKKRVSRTAKAFFSICAGLFGGIFAFNQFQTNQNVRPNNKDSINVSAIDLSIPPVPQEKSVSEEDSLSFVVGEVAIQVEEPNTKSNKRKTALKIIRKR